MAKEYRRSLLVFTWRSRLEREITIFTSLDADVYQRTEEHHTLRLFPSGEVEDLVRATGFDVEVLNDYRSPTSRLDLPGWYVVEARKPR